MENALAELMLTLKSAKLRGVPEAELRLSLERTTSEVEKLASKQPMRTYSHGGPFNSPLSGSFSLPALQRGGAGTGGVFSPNASFSPSPRTGTAPQSGNARGPLLSPKLQAGMKPWGLTQREIKKPTGGAGTSNRSKRDAGEGGSPKGSLGRGGRSKHGSHTSPADRQAQRARASAHVIGALRAKAEELDSELNRQMFYDVLIQEGHISSMHELAFNESPDQLFDAIVSAVPNSSCGHEHCLVHKKGPHEWCPRRRRSGRDGRAWPPAPDHAPRFLSSWLLL